jgi:hypothetical protein
MECNGMLAVHILCIMYQWKSRSSELLKTACHQCQMSSSLYRYFPCFYTLYITRIEVIPYLIQTVQELVHMIHLQDMHYIIGFYSSWPDPLGLQ